MKALILFGVLLISGAATYLIRLSFIALEGRMNLPQRFRSALPYVPAAMLTALIAQAQGNGSDLVTLRAIVEEASELGASRALRTLGLLDDKAGPDIIELRQLIQGWRDAKKSALSAALAWAVRTIVALFLFGLAFKLGLIERVRG